MSRPRIVLLDASHGADHTRRNFRRELDAALTEFDASAGELPPEFAYDAAVVTGSKSSVYWDEHWIDGLTDWIGRAADHMPILGVCYGHQALAAALGGRVEAMDDVELGYREINRSGDDLLLSGLDSPFVAFETHSDRVVELPPDATLLAENDRGVQAFRRGDCWGVQFHPEYDRSSAETVTRDKDLPRERIDSVVADITADNYAAACRTKRLFDNFVAYVRERTATATERSVA
jgi:GMP synthase (glutamine-hydrolysing)